MADLASTDLTYTQLSKSIGESGYRQFQFSIAFGNSTLTYPSGGIPLTSGKLGCPNQIRTLSIYGASSGDGITYKYDVTNNKIRLYRIAPAGTVAAPTFTGNAIQPTFTVKTGTIGSNMTTGLTADAATASFVGGTGITADRSLTTNNPVGTVTATGTNSAPAFTGTAANLTEFVASTTAPAATTLYISVTGW